VLALEEVPGPAQVQVLALPKVQVLVLELVLAQLVPPVLQVVQAQEPGQGLVARELALVLAPGWEQE
jgi:hypothetical protein